MLAELQIFPPMCTRELLMLFWKSTSGRLIRRVIDLAHVELCQSHRLCYNRAS